VLFVPVIHKLSTFRKSARPKIITWFLSSDDIALRLLQANDIKSTGKYSYKLREEVAVVLAK
jgi:hypothetical protein